MRYLMQICEEQLALTWLRQIHRVRAGANLPLTGSHAKSAIQSRSYIGEHHLIPGAIPLGLAIGMYPSFLAAQPLPFPRQATALQY